MPDNYNGQIDYPSPYAAKTRFINCVLHYAEMRVGTAFSGIEYVGTSLGLFEDNTVVLYGFWGPVRRYLRSGPPEVFVKEDDGTRTCSAEAHRVPVLGSPMVTKIITVPIDNKMPDENANRLLDAVQVYFAALRG